MSEEQAHEPEIEKLVQEYEGANDGAPAEEAPVADLPETPSNPIVEAMRGKGYEFDDDLSDDDLVEALGDVLSKREKYEQLEQLAPHLHEYAAHAAEFQEFLKSKQAPPKEEPKEDPFARYRVPEPSEGAKRLLEIGMIQIDPKTNLYKATDQRFLAEERELNNYLSARQKVFQGFEKDPVGWMTPIIEAKLQEQVQAKLEEIEAKLNQFSTHTKQSEIEKYFQQHGSEYWDMSDPSKPKLNAKGRAYEKAVKALEDTIPDEVERHRKAVELASLADSFSPPTDKKQAPQSREEPDRNKGFMNRIRKAGKGKRPSDDDASLPALQTPSPKAGIGRQASKVMWEQALANARERLEN